MDKDDYFEDYISDQNEPVVRSGTQEITFVMGGGECYKVKPTICKMTLKKLLHDTMDIQWVYGPRCSVLRSNNKSLI